MCKKLEKNGMWESSRMMLPEHREAIIMSNQEVFMLTKPVLYEQEIELVNTAIRGSVLKKDLLELTLYNVYQFKTITGTIERIDHQMKQVKLIHVESGVREWIPLQNILKAEVKEQEDFGDLDW